MPPRARITKEMIIEAGFAIVREAGHERLTVRAISERLRCSTQPILYHFSSAGEIRDAVYERADRFHSAYILPKGGGPYSPLTELGMNYVRFGYAEKNLFRFLFQSGRFSGLKLNDLLEHPELEEILRMVAAGTGAEPGAAKEMFLAMFITAHGCASLLAGNAMEFEEERLARLLRNTLRGQ